MQIKIQGSMERFRPSHDSYTKVALCQDIGRSSRKVGNKMLLASTGVYIGRL